MSAAHPGAATKPKETHHATFPDVQHQNHMPCRRRDRRRHRRPGDLSERCRHRLGQTQRVWPRNQLPPSAPATWESTPPGAWNVSALRWLCPPSISCSTGRPNAGPIPPLHYPARGVPLTGTAMTTLRLRPIAVQLWRHGVRAACRPSMPCPRRRRRSAL